MVKQSYCELYNPLAPENIAANIANTLLDRSKLPLGDLESFGGAGCYLLFYSGSHSAYKQLDCDRPIYIGKAIACRKQALYVRLCEHAKSIEVVESLDIADFTCKFCVLDELWIPLAEHLMIAKFQPVWNVVVKGFGCHVVGAGRQRGRCSLWDTLHPGRRWAAELAPRCEDAAAIRGDIEAHLNATR